MTQPPPAPASDGATATPDGAMNHARAMAGTVVETMPVLPATSASPLPGVDASDLLWHEMVAGGGYTSLVLARGARLRLVDRDGDACAGVLLHRFGRPNERLNVADTVKIQWQAYLDTGKLLLSDMGRVLAAIVEDTSGRHDAFCGTTNLTSTVDRYGAGAIDSATPNGRDLFELGLAKQGLDRRDVAPNINFFKGVNVEPDGSLRLLEGVAGCHVTLRCEMPVIATIVNVAHPLDERDTYTVSPLQVTAWKGEPAAADDPIRIATPEAERAYLNTEAETAMTTDLLGVAP